MFELKLINIFWCFKCLPLIMASLKSVREFIWFHSQPACNIMNTCKYRYCPIKFKRFNFMLVRKQHSPHMKRSNNVVSWATTNQHWQIVSVRSAWHICKKLSFFSRSYRHIFEFSYKHNFVLFYYYFNCLSGIMKLFHVQDYQEETLLSTDSLRKWCQF